MAEQLLGESGRAVQLVVVIKYEYGAGATTTTTEVKSAVTLSQKLHCSAWLIGWAALGIHDFNIFEAMQEEEEYIKLL